MKPLGFTHCQSNKAQVTLGTVGILLTMWYDSVPQPSVHTKGVSHVECTSPSAPAASPGAAWPARVPGAADQPGLAVPGPGPRFGLPSSEPGAPIAPPRPARAPY